MMKLNRNDKRTQMIVLTAAIVIPIFTGSIASIITSDAMKQYWFMNKPPLSPPGWLFPVVWTLLYILMGLASYIVFFAETEGADMRKEKRIALSVYFGQLAMNFVWSILFFSFSLFLVAFIWLLIMWTMIVFCTILFFRIEKLAGFLMLPLIAWVTFAAYLNCAVYVLSITPMILPR